MSITTFPLFQLPVIPYNQNANPNAFNAVLLNASGDKCAFIIQAPKAGTLHSFEWRTGTVNNNPDNGMKLSFQTVDPATGFPDGTPDQFYNMAVSFSSASWQIPAGPLTDDGTGGGVKRTVTRGEVFACVIEFVTFVASDSINIAVLDAPDRTEQCSNAWYIADASTGTYAKSGFNIPILALKYDDSTYAEFPMPLIPILASNAVAVNTGTTPDEVALRFQVPVSCRVSGAWFRGVAGGDYTVKLLDDSNTLLASIVVDKDTQASLANSTPIQLFFDTAVTLSAATWYRLVVFPSTATSVTIYNFTVSSTAQMAAVQGGANMYYSHRTDAGAWTNVDTTRPLFGLLIDGIEVSAGGGSGGNFAFVG